MIVQINLLPKRYLKTERVFSFGKMEMVMMASAAVLILAMVGMTWSQNNSLAQLDKDIVEAERRTQLLEKDIKLVDGLMDMKQKIAARMQAVEKLDRHRSSWVRIMEDVTGRIPDFVWLSSFAEVDPTKSQDRVSKPITDSSAATAEGLPIKPVEINGFSFTLNALAAFMIKLMRSNFFDEVDLVYAREFELENKKACHFKIQGRLHYLSDEELRTMLAAEKELKLLTKK
jgi:Tfp pilus assembly protein PilN